MAAAASSAGSSPCISLFIEESLVLPTRNARVFAPVFALVFAHTFVFLSVAVLFAHPLAAAIHLHADALRSADPGSYGYAAAAGKIRGHAKTLLLLYLAYLASKLATQVAVALAASATCSSGDRPSFAELIRRKVATDRIRGPFVTAAFVAVLELASTALLVVCLASWWRYGTTTDSGTGAAATASFASGCLLFLVLLALLSRLCLAAVFQVAIAASAAEEGHGRARALRRAWQLMGARRKEAAVQVLVVSLLLPVATYPVYAFALHCAQSDESVWVLAVLYGYLLPSVGVQLYSTVAATVFYHRCMEHHEPAIPLAMKQ